MRRLLALCLTLLALGLVACGGDDDGDTGEPRASTQQTTTEAAAQPCKDVEEPAPREVKERKTPTFEPKAGTTYVAVLETSCGTLEITLDTERAPVTTGSFISLVRDGFYDGLAFHRIIPGFVVQGGDPQGTGEGGPGYSVTEAPPEDLRYERGIVAMAKTQLEEPGTSGSQFFIVTGPQGESLTPDYALVGKVTEGDDVLTRLDGVQADPANDDRPVDPVIIEKATIRAE